MNKDGADSPQPLPKPVPPARESAREVSPPSSGTKAPGEVDESATLARSVPRPMPRAMTPPRPMPHARIRPTASFPRVSLSAVPAQRPPAPALPLVSAVPLAPAARASESESEGDGDALDAVTQHRAPLEVKRANDDVTQTAQVVVVPAAPVGAAGVTLAAEEADATVHTPGPLRVLEPRKPAAHDTKEATALVQGDVIGGLCRIEERLALSEMSVLYRAFHLQLERMVVVKVLQDAGVENVEAVARFRREACLMSLVTSEHVARVLDVGSHVGCPFIVMERLEGADLAYLLKQVGGRLSLKQACDLVLQICEALAVAHSYGIVHRDLKPANVFVSVRAGGDLRVTIIDFGIAKAFFERQDAEDQLTKVNGLLGSPRYMAPEQVEPHMEVDERADIWALGILFQEMLTGERVFIAEGIGQLLMAIVDKQPVALRTHLPDAPDAIVATLAQALEKDATRRLPNALTFAARVAPFASPDAIQRVAKIAAITAASVERAAESRPAFQERATLPPKSPSTGVSGAGATTVPTMLAAPLSPALRGAQASSNPPPTMRLTGPVSLRMPSPGSPPVPPAAAPPPIALVAPELEPSVTLETLVPVSDAPPALAAFETSPATLASPAIGVPGEADVVPSSRSRMRSPVVLSLLAVAVAAVAFAATMMVRSGADGASPPAGAATTASASPPPAVTATTETIVATSPPTAASPSTTAEPPADTASASAAAAMVPVAVRPPASASATASASPIASAVAVPAVRPAASASAAPAAAAGTGKLTVVCLPKCDQILDNGEVLGNGYVFGEEVRAGRHTLVLSTPAGAKKTMSVDVLADATKEVRVSMEK